MSIEIRDITKQFGRFTALQPINLTVPTGKLTSLLGPSGCGKTTLLRIIAGLELADTGRILFDGEDVTDVPVQQRNIGFMFQHYALFRHMTVFENVAFGLRVKPRAMRPSESDIHKKVHDLLNLVQLDWLADRYPSQLSGGQRQRIALARALAVEPKVLLLDEPFGALDALTRGVIQDELLKICASTKQTVFMITHDVDEAVLLADKIMLMSNGPNARIAEIVVNTLPKDRKRASLHRDPMYYPMRNHLVDFLVNRSKDLQLKGSAGELDGYQPTIVRPGIDTPLTQ